MNQNSELRMGVIVCIGILFHKLSSTMVELLTTL